MGVFTDAAGALTASGAILIAVVLVVAALIAAILVIIIKFQKKEPKEVQMDAFAEYGAQKQDVCADKSADEFEEKPLVTDSEPAAISEVKPEPVPEPQPVKEPEPPVIAVEPERAVEQTEAAQVAAAEPAPAPIEEEPPKPAKQPVKPSPKAKKTVKKVEDWSNYDGAYDGYYYDPEDACYYAGEAPTALLKQKNADKEKELQEADKKTGAKKIIKRIAPPSAALNTPKHARKTPKEVEGFDDSVIYGKYVIENESGEYYFTLYSNKEEKLFESKNYTSEEFARKAIQRFKSQVLVGKFVVEGSGNSFRFVLTRKGSVNEGLEKPTVFEADKNAQDVKYYAQTDIIRVQ